MRKWLPLLVMPVVFFLFNCAAPIPVEYEIKGTVKMWDGTALPNVTVKAGTKQTETDADGEWSITGLTGTVTVSAELQDYYIVVKGTVNPNKEVSSEAKIDFTAYSETGDFGGGTGTENDPYIIVTAQQLNNIRNHLDKHFKQIKNINLNDLKSKSGTLVANWEPVRRNFPVSPGPFTGSYNGMGFEIQNMVVLSEVDGYTGFFGVVSEASITNIVFKNATVDCDASNSGIFAGGLYDSVIDRIIIENSSLSQSSYIGGFASLISGATITNCEMEDVTVMANPDSGGYRVGGFVADASGSWFENCSLKNVQVHSSNSSEHVGGFAANSGISGFKDCSFEGTINATATYIGGFVGYASWHEEEPGKMSFDSFENCSVSGQMYARRNPSHMDGYVGGFVGWIEDVPNFVYCTVQMDITVDLNATTVAGFAGSIDGSEEVVIFRCSFEGSINAPDDFIHVSGFAFTYSNVSFDQCYADFAIQTDDKAEISGFLTMIGDVSGVSVTNSYAKGTLNSGTGSTSAGFIIMSSDVHPTVEKCYSAVKDVGCAFLYNYYGEVTTPDCYYDSEICNSVDDFSTAIGKTTTEMKTQSTYTGWDFDEIWDINPSINEGYPYLIWEVW